MPNMKQKEQKQNNEQTGNVTPRYNVFNEKKNKLKTFSKNLPKEADLPRVPNSGGLFGLFNYDVTGSDLNDLVESIQDKMIEQNKVLVRTIKEFNTIYDTFSALDKEYIQGILISLKAAEEANLKALKGIEGVQENQNEIKQIINQQKKVIQVLKNFKENIDKIEHLADMDKIFVAFSTMQSNVKVIEGKVKAQELIVDNLTGEMKELLYSQSGFQNDFNYLKENQDKQFKTVKQLVSNQNDNIFKMEEIVKGNNSNIENLNKQATIKEEKIHLTIDEVIKNNINFENAIKELKVVIAQKEESMSAGLESELANIKNDITELSLFMVSLSRDLKTTKVVSFASAFIICVLVSLIVSGVL